MFSAFLSDITRKSRRKSVNWLAHKVEVHDIMKAVNAIDFTTSGVSFLCNKFRACAQGLTRGRNYRDFHFCDCSSSYTKTWRGAILKAINEPEATNASKLTPKDLAPFVNNKEPIITNGFLNANFACENSSPLLIWTSFS